MRPTNSLQRYWLLSALLFSALLSGAVVIWILSAHGTLQSRRDRDLIAAIKRRDTNSACRLLNDGANANTVDTGPQLPMLSQMIYRIYGKLNCSPAITVWYSTEVCPPTIYGAPAGLDQTSYGGGQENLPLIRAFVMHGASVNARDYSGVSLLHHAVADDHYATVKFLLEHGADPNIPLAHAQLTPISYADARSEKMLIAHGAKRSVVSYRR